MLVKDFHDYPPGCLLDQAYDNKTADWVYTQVKDEEGSGGKGFDSHEKWELWGKDGDGQDEKDGNIEQDWREKIASAAMVARQKGKLPGGIQDLVQEILQPKLDWKAILRDMVTSVAKTDFRWNPPNKKHLHRGFVLPGVTGEEIRIAAAIDTSGSISEHNLAEFLGEIEGICQSYENYTLYLYAADAAIQAQWELHQMDQIPRKMPGRGGTDFCPVFEDLSDGRKEFSVLVYLTDLCGTFPQKAPNFPVIWVSTTSDKVPFGTVILLEEKR
jgi:predicted metal-dependent peptidase